MVPTFDCRIRVVRQLFVVFNSSDVCANDAAAKAAMGIALLLVGC